MERRAVCCPRCFLRCKRRFTSYIMNCVFCHLRGKYGKLCEYVSKEDLPSQQLNNAKSSCSNIPATQSTISKPVELRILPNLFQLAGCARGPLRCR